MKSFEEIQVLLNPTGNGSFTVKGENINPKPTKGGGVNPFYDAAQIAFERKDVGKAMDYRNANETHARGIAEKHIRQAKTECGHLRDEFVTEIQSATNEFL